MDSNDNCYVDGLEEYNEVTFEQDKKCNLRVEERMRIKKALKRALEASIKRSAGAGCVEYSVNGDLLYDRVSGILDTI